jgi:hypothetical protein
MPQDPFIREKFKREHSARPGSWRGSISSDFPRTGYETEVESWRHLQSSNYEFTMKRLREPKADA